LAAAEIWRLSWVDASKVALAGDAMRAVPALGGGGIGVMDFGGAPYPACGGAALGACAAYDGIAGGPTTDGVLLRGIGFIPKSGVSFHESRLLTLEAGGMPGDSEVGRGGAGPVPNC
jgi:hypothetical protein